MTLSTRIGIGLLVAGILVAMLQWVVVVSEARQVDADHGHAAPARSAPMVEPPPDIVATSREVLDSVRGEAEVFHLAPSVDALPRGCAPVFEVRPGGAIRIPVAPPVSMTPAQARWSRVGILLPVVRLAGLSAPERASLVAIWSTLGGARGVTADRVRVHGCRFEPGELELLLRWIR